MRRILIFILLLTTFSGCEKQDTVSSDGYYQGSLVYQGQPFFAAISFDGNNYAEVASGGALIQKFPCVTKGTYTIKHNTISFAPTVLPVIPDCQCGLFTSVKFDCQLNGDYKLIQTRGKIIFQRGSGNELQVYTLTLIGPDR
jgi:hypothetical protein